MDRYHSGRDVAIFLNFTEQWTCRFWEEFDEEMIYDQYYTDDWKTKITNVIDTLNMEDGSEASRSDHLNGNYEDNNDNED